ncbi:MAG: hypothetical protein H6551_06445 [Chitinophagales bacterium]|nr:hypothetical protein [Chitinophagaceae bacterium]MCB9064768.1 hypothetical protein [Chitinophagales bacterium]
MLAGLSVSPNLYAQKNADSASIARQRIIDSTRKAQKEYFDSMKVARQHIIDSTRAAQKKYNDSVQLARQKALDSSREAREKYYDSLKTARQQRLDSIKAERQRVSDSLAAIRAYRTSDRFKDSVAAIRQARLDSIKVVRQARLDSIKAERQRITDSIVTVRKAYIDSIRTVQKHRSDSLAAIRKYRESARYKDSVAVVRKLRLDSIKAVRKTYYDSIATARKEYNDSVAAVRKAYTDSITTVRKAYADSLKEVRQVRADSLAKIREKREEEKKIREKQRQEKMELALELKIKKKREAWSNEKMLKKRWGFPRAPIQNTFTRYNYYFNADNKMDEALNNMLRFRQENYDSLLALYPFDPDRDSSVLASDMDSIIQKASLGIQIHDPRTKWGDDLYLLLGQAYYYKGDYKNAGDAFKYVVSLRDKRKKKKRNSNRPVTKKDGGSIVEDENNGIMGVFQHRTVHNEAILWLARTLTESEREEEAETILDLIQADPNFEGSLEGRVALEKAYIRLSQRDYSGATEYLTVVTKDKKLPDWIRRRAAFINGQLLYRYENYPGATNSYRTVLKLNPELDMGFYAKKNMATSMMNSDSSADREEAIDMLKKVLKDGKYVKYYEQVYYVLGRLEMNNDNYDEAVKYLTKGIASPKSTAEQKAISYATLGDIHYKNRAYEAAKYAYDSAAILASSAPETDQMRIAIRRSDALSYLTVPLRKIRENDSLLYLASLSDKEQRSIVRKYIKMLEDKRRDSIFLAENAGLNNLKQNTNSNKKNNYSNWYFNNPTQMQKGQNAFKQKWGNRPLVDNWRRLSSGGFAQDISDDAGNDVNDGIPSEETLLAAIPKDENEKQALLDTIKLAYIDAANAYVQDLQDYPPALTLLDTFSKRFPNNIYKADVLYLKYLIALRQGKLEEAQKYADEIITKHGDSHWASVVKPTEDGGGFDAGKLEDVVPFYDKTYSLLLQREYTTVLPRAKEGQKRYGNTKYNDKFMIMEAISLASLNKLNLADSVMTVFMTAHTDPNDSLRGWAEAVLKLISENRVQMNRLPMGNKIQDTTSVDSAKMASVLPQSPSSNTQAVQGAYTYEPQQEHYVIFTFVGQDQRTAGVKAGIDDFNKFKFGSLNLGTEINMLREPQGVITIKAFRNKNQAVIYINSLKKTDQVFREYESKEYQLMMISKSNHRKLVTDKNLGSYIYFYNKNYK